MEKILYSSRTHPKILAKAALIQLILVVLHVLVALYLPSDTGWQWFNSWGGLVLHLIIVGFEVWFFVVPVMKWWNDKFIVTSTRVRNEWGVLYKHSREIDLSRISSISEQRGILDRLFGAGTLNFYDAAAVAQPETSGPWNEKQADYGVRFRDVPRVKHVRQIIEQARYGLRDVID